MGSHAEMLRPSEEIHFWGVYRFQDLGCLLETYLFSDHLDGSTYLVNKSFGVCQLKHPNNVPRIPKTSKSHWGPFDKLLEKGATCFPS